MATKLAVSHLSKSFWDLEVLRSIDLEIERGEFITLVGPSGCGKTTFLRIVAGLERATSGDVLLDGRLVRAPGTDRGFVFQNDSLLPWRTVFANAIIGREIVGSISAADRNRTMELLKLVGLQGFEQYHPRQLSGGMHQIDEAVFLSDRVLVLARRPGRLQAEVRVGLPRPRTLTIKRTSEFVSLVDRIWRMIEDDVRTAALFENA